MRLEDHHFRAIGILSKEPEIAKTELARQVGFSTTAIYSWLKDDDFLGALRIAREGAVNDALFMKAVRGDTKAATDWLKLYGEEHRREYRDDFAESLQLNEEDMERIAHSAYEYIRAKQPA